MTVSLTRLEEQLLDNPAQLTAFRSTGHCVVLAGPGSGKTKVLTAKIARTLLLDTKAPRGVACVTYNNECVRELRRRLSGMGLDEGSRLVLGTLHSFCLAHILAPFGRMAGRDYASRKVAPKSEAAKLLQQACDELHQRGTPVISAVHALRRDYPLRSADPAWERDPLAAVAERYEELLDAAGLVDFQTIISDALDVVRKNEWARRALRAQFPVLFIDEYQDLGLALHLMVQQLCLVGGMRLFAVGDPDQSIYGFLGARPDLLRGLAEQSDVEDVRLRFNYRSARKVIGASEAVLGHGDQQTNVSPEEGSVSFHAVDGGISSQIRFVVSSLLPSLARRVSPGEIVILFPTKNEGDALATAMKTAGLDHVRLGPNAAFTRTPASMLVEEAARWCSGGWRVGTPRLSQLFYRWEVILGNASPEIRRANRHALVQFFFAQRDVSGSAAGWIDEFFRTVILGDVRQRLAEAGQLDSLDEMREAFAKGGSLEGGSVALLAGHAGSADHFNLLTLHSSKGSEYRVVVMLGADEGRIPHHKSAKDARAVEEARRVFYVGVSRAREEVHFVYSNKVVGDNVHGGPSRFVQVVRASVEPGEE